jgi:hypothetical protein
MNGADTTSLLRLKNGAPYLNPGRAINPDADEAGETGVLERVIICPENCSFAKDTGTVLVSHSFCPENCSFEKGSRRQDGSTSLLQPLRVRIPGITIFILYGAAFGGVWVCDKIIKNGRQRRNKIPPFQTRIKLCIASVHPFPCRWATICRWLPAPGHMLPWATIPSVQVSRPEGHYTMKLYLNKHKLTSIL